MTPAQFNKELAALGEDVPEIIVRINSPGGDVFAANVIYTRLKDHAAKIIVKIDGWAASAATIIAMAGDTIKIARNGVFMIHDPAMTVWDTFKAEDFEKMAEELKVIKQSIINTYAMKTGRDAKEISDYMSDEKWWTGEDAVEHGFCDELMFEESKTVVENANRIIVNSVPFDITNFKSVPKELLKSVSGKMNTVPENIHKKNNNQEEETGMEPKNSEVKTIEDLKAAYPDLTAKIEEGARAEERERIKAIKEAAVDGFEKIVEDAMFGHPVSAEKMALNILKEQKKQGGTYLENRNSDIADSGIGEVDASAGEKGDETKNPFEAAIDQLYPETK